MRLPKRYIQLITLLLTVLIATPCSIKKLYNDPTGIETSHKAQNGNAKVQCQAFVADKKEHDKKVASLAAPGFKAILAGGIPQISDTKETSRFFLLQKEKVPTYLLYRSLLI